jgi:hypothetical protein
MPLQEKERLERPVKEPDGAVVSWCCRRSPLVAECAQGRSRCASDCRWPKPACSARVPALAEAVILAQSRANVALKFNRVALSLAYYCDEEHC